MNQQEIPDGEGFQGGGGDPDLVAFGAPPPPPPRRRPRRVTPLAAVAALALAGGAGVGFAVTHSGTAKAADTAIVAASSPTTSPSASPSASKPVPGRGGFHRWIGMPRAGFMFGSGGMVHGQFTVPKSGGGYQTVDVQRGTVSAVSASSVTVKSPDGFTTTYAVTSSTVVDAESAGIGSVKKGDTVFVTATVSGTTATAADITDLTAVKAGRASFGFPGKRPAMPAAPAAAMFPGA